MYIYQRLYLPLMTLKTTFLGLALMSVCILTAQNTPKIYSIQRCAVPPSIDGRDDDPAWDNARPADGFRMLDPDNGPPERTDRRTEVKLTFDDQAIYVFARMYDNEPDSILSQFSPRDTYNVNTDYFGIFINPFNDGLSDFNFFITAAGVQTDSRTTENGDDVTWNTVWESEVRIDDLGWTVELRIPYQCLRFSEGTVKDWGLNMMRYTRRNRQNYTWNFIDKSIATYELQAGILRGMENIEPPIRLSLMPYVSAYESLHPDGSHTESANLGMDLKYGINESFTLDATLIPDFGQVAYDEQFLNLGPFENQFQENRQFFVEGTDLFSKGGLFYSRRIGGTPINFSTTDVGSLSGVTQNYTRLINATKVSGRTGGNLGVGVLNAITDDNYSTGTDSLGREVRFLTEPLTNYNVVVLDQRINRNRSVSLVNTNVLRRGHYRDANVTALLANLNSDNNKYNLTAQGKYSHITQNDSRLGDFSTEWSLSKIQGNWRWLVSQTYIGDQYDQNDLGFQTRNNLFSHYAEASYEIFQPKGAFNRYWFVLGSSYSMLAKPNVFEELNVNGSFFAITRNFFAFGANLEWAPITNNDYFEPRTPGRKFLRPSDYWLSAWISSDYRKPFAIDSRIGYGKTPEFNHEIYSIAAKPIVRVNDRLNMFYEIVPEYGSNNVGWATFKGDSIIMGRREIRTVRQSFGASYVFTSRMSMDLSFRHYWRALRYKKYYLLRDDGNLTQLSEDFNRNLNFNTLNIDVRFSWWYAPGSEMTVLYRNSLIGSDQNVASAYGENFRQTLSSPANHIFSFRLTYFLDYATLAK